MTLRADTERPGAGRVLDAVVVGAGWAGLACAKPLADAGWRVALIEAAPQPGGRARPAWIGLAGRRVHLDAGQHLLMGAYRTVLATGRAVDPEFDRRFRRARLDLRRPDGLRLRRLPLPGSAGLALGLLSARGLSWSDRLAATSLLLSLRRRAWGTRPGASVADLLAEYKQPASVRERLWEPLCIGALNTMPAEACAGVFACVLRDSLGADGAATDFVTPSSTLDEMWAQPLLRHLVAHGVTIACRSRVAEIVRTGADWALFDARGRELASAPHVIVATDPWSAARVLGRVAPRVASALGEMGSEPIATAYLAWDQRVELPASTMLVESADRGWLGQWLFDRGGHAGLRVGAVVISAAARVPTDAGASQIARLAAAQVEAQLRLPACVDAKAVIERRATMRCTAGRPRFASDSAAAEIGARAQVWLCGDYLDPEYPSTLESAVRSGVRLAERLLAGAQVSAI